jgi:hypothetical protein
LAQQNGGVVPINTAPQQSGGFGKLLPIVLVVAGIWVVFRIIRARQRRAMGGMYGAPGQGFGGNPNPFNPNMGPPPPGYNPNMYPPQYPQQPPAAGGGIMGGLAGGLLGGVVAEELLGNHQQQPVNETIINENGGGNDSWDNNNDNGSQQADNWNDDSNDSWT